jgi:hypothetical protein
MSLSLAPLLALAAPLYAQVTPVDVTPSDVDSVRDASLDPGAGGHLVVTAFDPAGLVSRESFDAGASWVDVVLPEPGWFGEVRIDANGDLVSFGSSTPVGGTIDPLARRVNGAWVGIPVPVPSGLQGNLFVGALETHPTDPHSMALVTVEYLADGLGTAIFRAYATENDGATWTFFTSSSLDSDNGGVTLSRLKYMQTDQGTRVLIHRDYSDQSWAQTDVSSWAVDTANEYGEIGNSNLGPRCLVLGARTEPGLRFAAVPNNNSSTPVPIQRRFATGMWAPIGAPGRVTDIAAGNVDAELVVRHSFISSQSLIEVSRDAGETWDTLVDLTADSYFHNEIVGFSANDDALYERAQGGPSGGSFLRLLRIPVETALGSEECPGVSNTTGDAGQLFAIGRPEASANRVLLSIRKLPPQTFYLPIVSPDAGLIVNPGGSDGNLCLSGAIGRILDSTGLSTVWGEGTAPINLSQIPGPGGFSNVSAGDTWRFQVWYRDGGSSSTSNLTNSIAITFD